MNCGFALLWISMREALQFSEAKGRQSSSRAPGSRNVFERVEYWEVTTFLYWACPGVASAQGDLCLFSGGSDGPSNPCHVPHLSLSAPPPWLDPSGVHVERGSLG
ncbi:hypothetical protein TcYC6_0059810 [Trypanosoma cruzi]|nr:hypothetical protein TcYC6_0059810 [Trypanosoma cruzi]